MINYHENCKLSSPGWLFTECRRPVTDCPSGSFIFKTGSSSTWKSNFLLIFPLLLVLNTSSSTRTDKDRGLIRAPNTLGLLFQLKPLSSWYGNVNILGRIWSTCVHIYYQTDHMGPKGPFKFTKKPRVLF